MHLNNVLPMCGYPEDQLDNYKVKELFHTLKYFDVKWFACDQDLMCNYHTLVEKLSSINEQWCPTGRPRETGHPQTEIATITVDNPKYRAPCHLLTIIILN